MLWHQGPWGPWTECPFQNYLIPRDSKNRPDSMPFIYKPANLSPHLYCLLYWTHTQGCYFPTQITLGPSTRQLGITLTHQSLLKFSKLANSSSAHPALNILPRRNHNRGSRPWPSPHIPHPTWLTLALPTAASLSGVACPLLFGYLNNTYFLNGYNLLICWPRQTWWMKPVLKLAYPVNRHLFKIH